MLLTDRQVAKLHKAFECNFSAKIYLSKTQISKIIQLGRFLGRLLGPLMKVDLSLMKNVTKQLVIIALISLVLTASAAYVGIHKKF